MQLTFTSILTAVSALQAVTAGPLKFVPGMPLSDLTARHPGHMGNTKFGLHYGHIQPPVAPPDGGCIFVARLYKRDNQLRVYDSAPVCVDGETGFGPPEADRGQSHPLANVTESEITWAAYGWVFPDRSLGGAYDYWTKDIGCIWLNADMSTPWCEIEGYLFRSSHC